MDEDSWSRNHVGGIMKEESSRRNMEEESSRRNMEEESSRRNMEEE